MRLALTAFTRRGAGLALRLTEGLEKQGHNCGLGLPPKLAMELDNPGYGSLFQWAQEAFTQCGGLVFIGACGIAVRTIAPLLKDKFTDPAVVVVDESGAFAIPLLSGHVGGANALARQIAGMTHGVAVLSTATDVNRVFAVDEWAAQQGISIRGRQAAKHISAALLNRETVGFQSEFPVRGALPEGVVDGPAELGIFITSTGEGTPFAETLRLIPRTLNVGVGCRWGTSRERIATAVDSALQIAGFSPMAIKSVCTIDLKKDELGLLDFCRERNVPLCCFSAEALSHAAGDFIPSPFVQAVTGVDNVCERAAVLGGGTLTIRKQVGQGVTVAVSQAPYTVNFEEEPE